MLAKIKVKVVDLYIASRRNVSKALRYSHCQGIIQFYLHTLLFSRNWYSFTDHEGIEG